MATAVNPPLYLHVTSTSKAGLEQAIAKIEELMTQDLPNLVDERRFRRREPEQFERDEFGRVSLVLTHRILLLTITAEKVARRTHHHRHGKHPWIQLASPSCWSGRRLCQAHPTRDWMPSPNQRSWIRIHGAQHGPGVGRANVPSCCWTSASHGREGQRIV